MASVKQIILFVALLHMQLFGVYSAENKYVTSCNYDRTGEKLSLICSDDQSKDMHARFTSADTVECNNNAIVTINTVKTVEFSACHFGTLPDNLLARFRDLHILYVKSAGLSQIREADLPHNRLGVLVLSSNGLKEIDVRVLEKLSAATELDLSFNQIKNVPALGPARSLSKLILSYNGIEELLAETFHGLDAIQTIELKNNQLKHFHPTTFSTRARLINLDLSSNQLTQVPEDVFGLRNLKNLQLNFNQIKSVASKFAEGNVLETLNLSNNPVEKIHAGEFNNLNQLTKLTISNTTLTAIEKDAFVALKKLNELDLSINQQFSHIEHGAFSGLEALKTLRLNNNQLTSAALAFDAKDNQLQLVDLSGNNIAELRVGDFLNLKRLQILRIAKSQVKNIQLGTFTPIHNVIEVDLSHNDLSNIDFGLFAPATQSLEALRLNNNHLTELDDHFDQLFPKLAALYITENEFECPYLGGFLLSLRAKPLSVNVNPSFDHNPNIRGITCKHVPVPQPPQPPVTPPVTSPDAAAAAEAAKVSYGFASGYNVSIFILVLWISLTNLVICGAIVLLARRASSSAQNN